MPGPASPRSWHLFAIGLAPIFSFGLSLPPTLRSNPEELDFGSDGLLLEPREARLHCFQQLHLSPDLEAWGPLALPRTAPHRRADGSLST